MQPTISSIDLLVVLVYLVAAVALGLWIGRGNKNLDDYLLGGRTLPWWALLGSIVATETSTATFLSVPGIAYAEGGDFRFLQLVFGFIVGRCLVVVILLPGYFRGHLLTAYQLLQERFGGNTRRLASTLFLIARNLGDGLRLYITAIALREAIGVPLGGCILLIGGVTILYTLFGGMRSVVWNDCLQFLVYMIAGLATLWILADRLPGGADQLWSYAAAHDKLRLFDFSLDPRTSYTFWAGLIGGAFLSMGTHGTDQLIVQRCLAARNQRDAGKALIASGFVVLVQFTLFLAIGVGLAAFFAHFPPDQGIEKGDEAYARFIVQHLPTGLVGLTLAGVFAAAMSTLSSSLNSSSAALSGDFGPLIGADRWPPARQLWFGRLATVVFGAVQMGVAIVASRLSTHVISDALALAGFTAGTLLGVFCLGLLNTRRGQAGPIAGMIAGLTVLSLVKFQTEVAWPWYPVIGSVATVAVGLLAGWLFPVRDDADDASV